MNDPRPQATPLPEVELLLAEPGRMVVRVNRLQAGRCTSALGQADTAEDAEDRARQRLAQRSPAPPTPASPQAPAPSSAPQSSSVPHSSSPPSIPPSVSPSIPLSPPAIPEPPAAAEADGEPEDWSDELQAADRELERLGWDRDRSGLYLERAFGHPSRDRLVHYGDLVAWLQALRRLEPDADPLTAPLPLRRPQLLEDSDERLRRLGWGAAEGRQLLEAEFGVSSRQQLNDGDLQRFNQRLDDQLAGNGGG